MMMQCQPGESIPDASGYLEAEELIIAAESPGVLVQWALTEGQRLSEGEMVGLVDTTQLAWRMKQLDAQLEALRLRLPNKASQLAVLDTQIKTQEGELKRFTTLAEAQAVPEKQVDDLAHQLELLKSQRNALFTQLDLQTRSLYAEMEVLRAQKGALRDQLNKCSILNPTEGTVLVRYAKQYEMVTTGMPLYKLANLSELYLRAYASADQLHEIQLLDTVDIYIDARADTGSEARTRLDGIVSWISDKAEFTPKSIQTREERAHLVYALKIRLPASPALRIGMYGEVTFR
jgi:HlyD family secretion protein